MSEQKTIKPHRERLKPKKSEEPVIYINDDFRYIIHNDGNYQLQQKVVYEDGKTNFKFAGWFGINNFHWLGMKFINMYGDKLAKDEGVTHIKDILQFRERALKEMISHCRELKGK